MRADDILVPALINGTLAAVVLAAGRRSLLAGALIGLTILAVSVLVFWLWQSPGGPSRHSEIALFGTCFAIIAVTWLPGASLAVISGRLGGGGRAVFGTASILVALLLGGGFIVTTLALVCRFLADCP